MNRVQRHNNYYHPYHSDRVRESDLEAIGCAEEGCNQDAEEIVGLVNPDNNQVTPVFLCSRHYKELVNAWYDRESD